MPLSWNEIKDRALRFSREWKDEASEDAEAKSFWDAFFDVFGVSRRRVAAFEKRVKKVDGKDGFIDLLWKGVLLIEHKSRGKDLDRAHGQARDYFHGLSDAELPKYLLVSDFARFRLYDLDSDEPPVEFPIGELHRHIRRFGFIAGYQARSFKEEDPVNIQAAERMGKLHDALKAAGFDGHALEVLLVRLLFCLFADDTGIFQRHAFHELVVQRTSVDGADLGLWLAQLFQVLNTAQDKRQKTLDAQLAEFPYVNGKLFEEPLPLAAFDATMRQQLLDASALDWSRISPAIFGSMFQSVMDSKARRNLGAHYTSEKNILKLIGPLFLDGLKAELDKAGNDEKKLAQLHKNLATLKFLDPACGCGNFLVIAYRELRQLELEVLTRQFATQQSLLAHVSDHVLVDVDQFHGIEIEEFPAQIAQVAMWLMDHQMNLRVAEQFGENVVRLPLKKSAVIVHGNALRIDWNDVVRAKDLSFILGNPPFVGKKEQNTQQKADMAVVFYGTKGAGVLDFVAAWYQKAADFISSTSIRCAFVSTNSITQGEQVGVLWPLLHAKGIQIQFAHRTFRWSSEARGKAAVHCVIIGFGLDREPAPQLADYGDVNGEPNFMRATEINPYLVDGPFVALPNRSSPISTAPSMNYGSFALDDGNYTLDASERAQILASSPQAEGWLHPFIGGQELLHSEARWCLWLLGADPTAIKAAPVVLERVEKVRTWRSRSERETTKKLAATPTLFAENRQPTTSYVAIPTVSSEKRLYIPMAFLRPETVASNQIYVLADATLFHFGVLHSQMHMSWIRSVCGRLESRYRYSAGIVYNNFPWPELADAKHHSAIETAAQGVLDARAKFPGSTLADLYDPLTMPPALVKAHQALDRAVDAAYLAAEKAGGRKTPKLGTDAERVAFLFERYQALTSLLPAVKPKKVRAPRSDNA
ncbi:class I SAM-dependent DNA methyltransferase [Lysobacter solisilvae (ex Woo and Kim 2020)]|uniref:site-specific DNA-methyltransferase (adenine-specific) n=1 Tax=Agrilutibacter terrestris TaxID=2865112 RepID=A0A7H0FUF7_9GAMM|nr:class I SAM-dependent DNA methyltransferase [Lysobacter terrestris]QNP39673.1 class I SAM-dependent DNA methyltransferase [Lysobacter terrestris]